MVLIKMIHRHFGHQKSNSWRPRLTFLAKEDILICPLSRISGRAPHTLTVSPIVWSVLSSQQKYSTQAARTGGGAGQQAEGEHGYALCLWSICWIHN